MGPGLGEFGDDVEVVADEGGVFSMFAVMRFWWMVR